MINFYFSDILYIYIEIVNKLQNKQKILISLIIKDSSIINIIINISCINNGNVLKQTKFNI